MGEGTLPRGAKEQDRRATVRRRAASPRARGRGRSAGLCAGALGLGVLATVARAAEQTETREPSPSRTLTTTVVRHHGATIAIDVRQEGYRQALRVVPLADWNALQRAEGVDLSQRALHCCSRSEASFVCDGNRWTVTAERNGGALALLQTWSGPCSSLLSGPLDLETSEQMAIAMLVDAPEAEWVEPAMKALPETVPPSTAPPTLIQLASPRLVQRDETTWLVAGGSSGVRRSAWIAPLAPTRWEAPARGPHELPVTAAHRVLDGVHPRIVDVGGAVLIAVLPPNASHARDRASVAFAISADGERWTSSPLFFRGAPTASPGYDLAYDGQTLWLATPTEGEEPSVELLRFDARVCRWIEDAAWRPDEHPVRAPWDRVWLLPSEDGATRPDVVYVDPSGALRHVRP